MLYRHRPGQIRNSKSVVSSQHGSRTRTSVQKDMMWRILKNKRYEDILKNMSRADIERLNEQQLQKMFNEVKSLKSSDEPFEEAYYTLSPTDVKNLPFGNTIESPKSAKRQNEDIKQEVYKVTYQSQNEEKEEIVDQVEDMLPEYIHIRNQNIQSKTPDVEDPNPITVQYQSIMQDEGDYVLNKASESGKLSSSKKELPPEPITHKDTEQTAIEHVEEVIERSVEPMAVSLKDSNGSNKSSPRYIQTGISSQRISQQLVAGQTLNSQSSSLHSRVMERDSIQSPNEMIHQNQLQNHQDDPLRQKSVFIQMQQQSASERQTMRTISADDREDNHRNFEDINMAIQDAELCNIDNENFEIQVKNQNHIKVGTLIQGNRERNYQRPWTSVNKQTTVTRNLQQAPTITSFTQSDAEIDLQGLKFSRDTISYQRNQGGQVTASMNSSHDVSKARFKFDNLRESLDQSVQLQRESVNLLRQKKLNKPNLESHFTSPKVNDLNQMRFHRRIVSGTSRIKNPGTITRVNSRQADTLATTRRDGYGNPSRISSALRYSKQNVFDSKLRTIQMDSTDASHLSTRLQNSFVPRGRNNNFFRVSTNMDKKRISFDNIRKTQQSVNVMKKSKLNADLIADDEVEIQEVPVEVQQLTFMPKKDEEVEEDKTDVQHVEFKNLTRVIISDPSYEDIVQAVSVPIQQEATNNSEDQAADRKDRLQQPLQANEIKQYQTFQGDGTSEYSHVITSTHQCSDLFAGQQTKVLTSTNYEMSEVSSDDENKPIGKKTRKYNDFNTIDVPSPTVSKRLKQDVNVKKDFLNQKKQGPNANLFRKIDQLDAEVHKKELVLRELNYKLTMLKCQSGEAKEIDVDIFTKIRSIQDEESNTLKYINLSSETQDQIKKELQQKREQESQEMNKTLFGRSKTSLNHSYGVKPSFQPPQERAKSNEQQKRSESAQKDPHAHYEARGYSGGYKTLKTIKMNKLEPNSLKQREHALFKINQLTEKIQEMDRCCDEEEMTEKQYEQIIVKEEESIKSSKLRMQLDVEPQYKKFKQVQWTHDFEALTLMDKTRKNVSTNLLTLKQREAQNKLRTLQERLADRVKILYHESKISDKMMEKVQHMDKRMNRIRQYMHDVKVRNAEMSKKKQQVVACIDSKMIEIKFIRQLQVLKSLRQTMKEVNKCTTGCKNQKNDTKDGKSLEHILNEPNANALILQKLRDFATRNQENILQINKSISDPQKITPPEVKKKKTKKEKSKSTTPIPMRSSSRKTISPKSQSSLNLSQEPRDTGKIVDPDQRLQEFTFHNQRIHPIWHKIRDSNFDELVSHKYYIEVFEQQAVMQSSLESLKCQLIDDVHEKNQVVSQYTKLNNKIQSEVKDLVILEQSRDCKDLNKRKYPKLSMNGMKFEWDIMQKINYIADMKNNYWQFFIGAVSTMSQINLRAMIMLNEVSKLIGNNNLFEQRGTFNPELVLLLRRYEQVQKQIEMDELQLLEQQKNEQRKKRGNRKRLSSMLRQDSFTSSSPSRKNTSRRKNVTQLHNQVISGGHLSQSPYLSGSSSSLRDQIQQSMIKIGAQNLGNTSQSILSNDSLSNSVIKETKESNLVTSISHVPGTTSNDYNVRLDIDVEFIKNTFDSQQTMEESLTNGKQQNFGEQFKLVPNLYQNLRSMLDTKEHSDFLDECLKSNFDTDRVRTYLDPFGFLESNRGELKSGDEGPSSSVHKEPLQNKMMQRTQKQMFDLKYINNLEYQKQMKRLKLMKKRAHMAAQAKGSTSAPKVVKHQHHDENDVDYCDPVTHAICGDTLAAEYKKEKQIKALEEFERKNKMLRDNQTQGNTNLELKTDVRCLRIYEKEEAQFGKVYKRNQEKVLGRFDRVFTASQVHEDGDLYSCSPNNPNRLFLEHFNSELVSHHDFIQIKKERLKSQTVLQQEAKAKEMRDNIQKSKGHEHKHGGGHSHSHHDKKKGHHADGGAKKHDDHDKQKQHEHKIMKALSQSVRSKMIQPKEIKQKHEFIYEESIDPPHMLDEGKVTSLLLKNFPNLATLKAFQNTDTDIKSLTSSQQP